MLPEGEQRRVSPELRRVGRKAAVKALFDLGAIDKTDERYFDLETGMVKLAVEFQTKDGLRWHPIARALNLVQHAYAEGRFVPSENGLKLIVKAFKDFNLTKD